MTPTVIRCDRVSKAYDLQAGRRTLFSSIKSATGAMSREGVFYALSDISCEIRKGESVGIIGKNGSGKSTLLKLIAGITQPSMGAITVDGRISSMIELGAGFHPDMSGRENILMNASILGLSRRYIAERFDEIVSFSELEQFIDVPIKRYSSGMYARLGFAVASSVEPDIFIVDEALSVGDMFFQAKCMSRIKEMRRRGVTLLFVSHDLSAVAALCQKAILLDGGRIVEFDRASHVIEKYFTMKVAGEQRVLAYAGGPDPGQKSAEKNGQSMLQSKEIGAFADTDSFLKKASFQRTRNGKVSFANVQLLDEEENPVEIVSYRQNLILRMAIEVAEDLPLLGYGYHVRDKNGVNVVYSDSEIENVHLRNLRKGERYLIDWKFRASLMHGNYTIACVLSVPIDLSISKVDFCDFVPIAAQFQMQPRPQSYLYGTVHWENNVDITKIQ
jgi:lipopolysaccharide transport system ATP-binding protein